MSSEPMSDERLASIKDYLVDTYEEMPVIELSHHLTVQDIGRQELTCLFAIELLAEIERLRAQDEAKSNAILDLYAQIDALRQIVEAVASSNPYGSWYPATNTPAGVVCRWCMERACSPQECQHDHECTWRQARAFLASAEAAGQTTASEGE